ncbi:PfkB family carbohydrate kinase [Jannaschia sp. LMIT008]|uniref:PfkB family carbohydrate kinase n=1 Tax=Jannaschia maritima TaxID=3032585 RepID=UPI002811083C|nr:PfkB family carbohydrate kinase [Jannaschia sp. LMIT008]
MIAGDRFLVVGRAGMDFYPDPPGTKTEHGERWISALGGSAANTAVQIVKLGGRADIVTCVSDDAVGRYACNRLDHYGVGRTHVRAVGGEARTSLAVVETTVEDHQSVIYRNGAADFAMDLPDVEAVDYGDYDALITAGTVFAADPSRTAAFRALDRGRVAGLPLVFDIDHRPYSWPSPQVASDVLSRAGAACDVVVGNDVEFGFMAGDYDAGLDKARSLIGEGARVVVYKMGERGAVTITPDAEVRTGIYPVDALKPTGAGDSFMGGLMAGLAGGMTLHDAVLQGSACAAVTVTRPTCSAALPDRAELAAFLQTHPGPTE